MLELIGLGIAIILVLWATGLLRPVQKLAAVASDSVERAANMADREMKKLDAKHTDKVVNDLAKIEIDPKTYEKAKSNLAQIKAFEL